MPISALGLRIAVVLQIAGSCRFTPSRQEIRFTMDSLHAAQSVLEAAEAKKMQCIIRLQAKKIPQNTRELPKAEGKPEGEGSCHFRGKNGKDEYAYISKRKCAGHEHSAACFKTEGHFAFIYRANLETETRDDAKKLAELGRRRWTIESQGFKTQKGHCHLEHQFSMGCRTMKSRCRLTRIGHAVPQMLEAMCLAAAMGCTLKRLHSQLKLRLCNEDGVSAEFDPGQRTQGSFLTSKFMKRRSNLPIYR
jgi:hypothetical protein